MYDLDVRTLNKVNNLVIENNYPWRRALEVLNLPPEFWESVNKNFSYSFFHLVPVCANNTFLNVGEMLGFLTEELCEDFEQGFCVAVNEPYETFLSNRFSQDSVENVGVIKNIGQLDSNSIDYTVVNNIRMEINPKLLLEIRDKMKPNSKLAIAISGKSPSISITMENLVNFSKLLPMTYWGYQNLLKKVGFREIKFYLVCPSLSSPKDVYLVNFQAIEQYYDKYHSGSGGIVRIVHAISKTFSVVFPYAYLRGSYYVTCTK